jgi:hypothetical protein
MCVVIRRFVRWYVRRHPEVVLLDLPVQEEYDFNKRLDRYNHGVRTGRTFHLGGYDDA